MAKTAINNSAMNQNIRVLIIDDDEVDRMHIRRSLKYSGLNCDVTEYEALRYVSDAACSTQYDCIFLDYLLPGETGLSLLKKFRDGGIMTPIVIITSQGNEKIAVELMKAGASDYIVKDQISATSIGKILSSILRTSQAEKEKEHAVNALKKSEARLAEAQRIAKIGNWEVNVEHDVMHWSPQIYDIFEVPSDVFIPTVENYIKFIDPAEHHLIHTTLLNSFKGGSFNIDLTARVSSGTKYINVQGYPILDEHNRCVSIFGTLQDITERKRTEQELLTARKLAEDSLNVREIFLANMSHEIRTPMNAVIGFTQLLYETSLTDEQKGFVDAISFSGDNLLVIINDILDLSKLQSGKMTLEKIEFNIGNLVKSTFISFKEKAKRKGLQLTYEIDSELPKFVKGDPVRLNQIITNLVNNAIKFTETGYVRLHVVGNDIDNEKFTLEFSIIDTGIGIPVEKQSLIFDSFVQASGDTSRKFGGTGLGLTIVKNLTELYGGILALESKPGNGSTFRVTLPFEIADQSLLEIRSQEIIGDEPAYTLKGASVLVVEDNHVNQLLIKRVLEKAGCRIDLVYNGVEGIDAIKTGKYDVVLMDIQMPVMDGYTATRNIRNSLSHPLCNIPIIAMTAHALTSEVDKCIAIGMNDYVSKPFKKEVLFSKMAKILRKNIQQDMGNHTILKTG